MSQSVLVTGATGYVGGRLVPRLLDKGYFVRALSRSRRKLQGRHWSDHPRVDLAEANAQNLDHMVQASRGCDAAYYLIHSMDKDQSDFQQADRRAAENMVQAAETAGMEQIIYLGGLGEEDEGKLSPHLRSRAEVARILQSGPVPTTVLRASIILGSGSASFEILRYLVDRLPIMITPRWVRTSAQPIAIDNVLNYLLGCLETPETRGDTFDIGGPDVMTYEQLMRTYARVAELPRRWILPVPVLTPRLSSYWVHLVTPVPASLSQPLIEGLKNPTICQDNRIRQSIPQDLLDCETAIERALQQLHQDRVPTHWSDAGTLPPAAWADPNDPSWAGGTLFEDRRVVHIQTTPEKLWSVITRIGGDTGWYATDILWTLRGWMDRLVGGVGLRRGRRDAANVQVGDALDFWRVLEVEPRRLIVLGAEMKLPGEAVLEFHLRPRAGNVVECEQRALFRPRGLLGILYWYGITPFHNLVFHNMLRGIARATEGTITRGPQALDTTSGA